jgi:hypothetical protein
VEVDLPHWPVLAVVVALWEQLVQVVDQVLVDPPVAAAFLVVPAV